MTQIGNALIRAIGRTLSLDGLDRTLPHTLHGTQTVADRARVGGVECML